MWHSKHSIHPAAAQAEDEDRSWGQLDINLLTAILCCLKTDKSPSPAALKDMMAATGVCQHWRNVGSALFFSGSSWQGQSTIRHPQQLVTLCPLSKAPGGLIRGQIRRVKSGWTLTGRRQWLLFHQSLLSPTGQTVLSGKFLLAAEQRASGSWAVFMNRGCKGQPVAVLSSNALRTMYTLTAVAQGDSNTASSSSSSLLERSSSLAATSYSSSSNSSSLEQYSSTWFEAQEAKTAAAAAAEAADAKVLMSLQYKLHLKAMVLPRRMSVCLQVPSQHTQRSLCTNSRTGQPPAAWQTPNVQLQHLQLQQQEQQEQQQPGGIIPAVQLQELEAAAAAAAAAADGGVAAGDDAVAVGEVLPAVGEPVSAPVLQKLENKQPHWNGALRVWCLNFNGRVKLSSAKNFQLVSAPTQQTQPEQPSAADNAMQPQAPQADGANSNNSMASTDATASAALPSSPGTGGIVVQFGKTEPHAFILDYDPCVTTALQAFAVALTTFGTKLLA